MGHEKVQTCRKKKGFFTAGETSTLGVKGGGLPWLGKWHVDGRWKRPGCQVKEIPEA